MEKPSVKKLIISMLLDLVGMATYFFPFIGESFDIIWAPMAGFILNRMYKGTVGKVGGIIVFLEEILPITDIIPTFTLTWMYTRYFSKEEHKLN
jgi:hypothetical protein